MIRKIITLLLFVNFTSLVADVTTWTKAQSPYRINDNFTVDAVDTLFIEAGVEILFDDNYDFKVEGVLKAKGFYSDSIFFKPDINNSNGWKGISLRPGSSSSTLVYCRIEGSNNFGIKIDDCQPPEIANCTIVNNTGDGIEIKKVQNRLSNCTVKYNDGNGLSLTEASTTILNSIISKNGNAGLLSSNAADSLSLINTVVADNRVTGVFSVGEYVFVKNSIIYYNVIEISSDTSKTDVTYSNIRGFTVYPGIGNINDHPDFDDLTIYTLSPTQSPCIDRGDPDSFYEDIYFPPSLGSNRNDMGAYGGSLAGEWYPPLFIQPDSLNFGKVSYDSTVTLTLSVKNYRDTTIIVDSIYFAGNDTSVFSADTDSLNIDVLDSAHINITFTPPDIQDLFIDTLKLRTKKYGALYVPIQGEGIIAKIGISPTELDFGLVDLGSSHELFVQVFNSGLDTLRLFQIYTSNSAFSVSDSSLKINPGPSLETISVTFTPDSIDIKTDSLIILNNDPDPEQSRIVIRLDGQGFGPIINLDSSSYNFGPVFLTSDSSLSIPISNYGNDSLLVDSIQIIKNDSNTFSIVNDSLNPIIIEPDSTFYVDIRFEPKKLGSDSAKLVIQNNDVFRPEVNIDLTGNCIAAVIELNRTKIDFGVIPFSFSSVDSIVIKNSGNYILSIEEDSLVITGNHPEFFNLVSVSSFQIQPGDSAIMFISFDADSDSIKKALLQIVSNDPINSKVFVPLTGESWAPEMSVSATDLDFGEVLKDSVSYLSLFIYNNGQGDLVIFEDSLYFSGSDTAYFQIDSITKFIINPGDSAFIRIQFTADKPDSNQATLHLLNNDPDQSNIRIDLSGFVLIPFIHIPNSTVDFGSIPLLSCVSQSLFVYNVGYEPLTVYFDSLEILGDDSLYFFIDSVLSGNVIQPDDSVEIILEFTASTMGVKNASLKVKSDDRLLPLLIVPLTGSSNTPQIVLSDSSLGFGVVPAGSDTTFTLIVRNTGQGDLVLYKEGILIKGIDSLSFFVDALDSNVIVNPQDSTELRVGLYTNNVGPKSAILQIQCNDYDTPLVNINLSGLVIDNPASVSLDQGHSNKELIYNQNGNLRFIVYTNFSTDSVFLNYRQGGADAYNQVHCKYLGQNLWEVTVDSSWITQRGFEYFVRVYHGWTLTDWPEQSTSMQVQISKMEFPEATQKEVYQKISIPFHTSNETLNYLFYNNLGAYDNTIYRIFDCENGNEYNEITNLDIELPPGKALWLITKNEVVLDFTNAKTVRTDSTFKLSLHAGWNMISTPFAFNIDWSEVSDTLELRYYDGTDWPYAYFLEPFKGYAVYIESDITVSIPPKEYTGTNILAKKPVFDDSDWDINLKVEQGNLKDEFNYAGVNENSNSDIDRYDHREPPPIGNYISLYIKQQNDLTGKIEKFSSDFREIGSEGYIYDFEVIGNVSGKKNLIIEANSLPENYKYVVVVPESKIKYETGNIELYSNKNKLRLIVGSEEFVNAQTVEYNFAPVTFNLAQNYPNPFNPSTNIKYQLPNFTKISIDIYNILGQKVRSLINNEAKDAGYYQVSWDGKNNSGYTVATGIYFLNFRSSQFSKSIKMLLQR